MITKHEITAAYNITLTCDKCNTIMNRSVYDKYTNTYNSICPNCGHVENTGSHSFPQTVVDYKIPGEPIKETINPDEFYRGKWIAFCRNKLPFANDNTVYHGQIVSIINGMTKYYNEIVFEVKNSKHGSSIKHVRYIEILGLYDTKEECYANDYKHKLGPNVIFV